MNSMKHLSFLVVAALSVMVACGGGNYDDPVAYAVEASESACSRAYECMAEFPADSFFPFEAIFGNNEAMCLAQFEPDGAAIDAAVNEGRTIYDAGAAERCADFVAGLNCQQYWDAEVNDPSCEDVWTGTLQDGTACALGIECVSGFCVDGACDTF